MGERGEKGREETRREEKGKEGGGGEKTKEKEREEGSTTQGQWFLTSTHITAECYSRQ